LIKAGGNNETKQMNSLGKTGSGNIEAFIPPKYPLLVSS
jgi:hypothetical protein